jgi:hypothetical protein
MMKASFTYNPYSFLLFLAFALTPLAGKSQVSPAAASATQPLPATAVETVIVVNIGTFPDSLHKSLKNDYPGRILSARSDYQAGTVKITYGPFDPEDILQIIRMKGYANPWFIQGNKKYMLNANGNLVYDEVKQ